MEHKEILPQGPVVPFRAEALQRRPELLAFAKRYGKLSADGQTYEVPVAALAGLDAKPDQRRQAAVSLPDKVRLGLCGRHKTAWEQAREPLRTPEANAALRAICDGCEAKWRGMEKVLCRLQPCTTAGRWAATYECPAGMWPKSALEESPRTPNH